ncbi:MAG: hypothetical protein K0U54_03260 [Bacteroidetes bacterium]|nr:hypothetical protein [Bacteroidota bacterium]
MKKLFLLTTITLAMFSCNDDDDCGACNDAPQSFTFDIVDSDTRENLFTNGTYDPDQIEIVNIFNGDPANFQYVDSNNLNYIQINNIGLETEIVSMRVTIANDSIFGLFVDTERIQKECCFENIYNEIQVSGSEYEYDTISDLYTILVD